MRVYLGKYNRSLESDEGDFVVILTITTSIGCIGQYIQVIHVDYGVGIVSPELSYSTQQATIYNVYGQQQSSQLIHQTGNGWTTNEEAISAGIYFIQCRTSAGVIVKKIIVQH